MAKTRTKTELKTGKSKPHIRIGYGWDSHEFQTGIPLRIGGVTLPHPQGLGGHSDGDVLLHALTDALLGGVAAPDIGSLFPPSDPQWKGAASAIFLKEALQRVRKAGYALMNVDSTLILAAPKIGPHAAAIRENVAKLLGHSCRLCRTQSQNSRRHGHRQRRHRTRGRAAAEKKLTTENTEFPKFDLPLWTARVLCGEELYEDRCHLRHSWSAAS